MAKARKNPFAEIKRLNELADHYEKLYMDTNHKLVHAKKELRDIKKKYVTQFPTGHFYSPYPDMKDMDKRKAMIFDRSKQAIPGIDINERPQLQLVQELGKFYDDFPYVSKKRAASLRYFFENSAYSYTDATILYTMLRKLQPKQVIEIGSGYSSALMLDTNEHFLDRSMALTFIEPYPELLLSLTRKGDEYTLIDSDLSAVDNDLFKKLGKGDILFVDSTHVSKAGSDVNQIFFQILPQLQKGVIVHVHDVFYPFEYPYEWIKEGRAWTEDYIVRAFLHNNPEYKILLFNHYLNVHHADKLTKALPITAKNAGGSLWLEKI